MTTDAIDVSSVHPDKIEHEADCPWPLCEQWLTSNPANESKG